MPPPQPPLTNQNAYTTWPGGVDPTTPLFNTDNQKFGGARSRRKNRKNRKSRKSRKSRKVSRRVRKNLRKASRRVRKNLRKVSRRARKNTRKVVRRAKKNMRKNFNWIFGVKKGGAPVEGPAVCTPIDTTGSLASFPRLTSVCPEGSFQQTGRLVAE